MLTNSRDDVLVLYFSSTCSVFRRMLYGEGNIGGKRSKKKQNFKPSDGYIEKYDFRGQPTVVVKDFEPEVFKQLVEYTHTGSVMLQARTLLGLMNAADHYGLEELKQACIRFMEHCVNTDTVCSLLSSAEKYIQYKSTKILVQKMFEFVDQNAEVILSLGAFSTLPQHVVRIVLGREDLNAAEISKFNAAFKWSIKFCDDRPDITLKQAFEPFVDVINFFQIPAKQLMRNIKPAEVIDDAIILNALAYQADPRSVDHIQLPNRPRKSTYCSTGTKYVSPMFRRVQSSGQSLANGSCRRLPPSDPRKVRSGSVPPLEHSRSEEKRVLQSEVHPARIHDVRPESRDSHLSSSPAVSSPKSPSSDSYQESVSSLGGTESESHETPTHSQRRFSYSTLDDIVTLSSKAVEV